jgi:phenylacetate-coenzyme A ligase PaaK-like adenylate-forming protein
MLGTAVAQLRLAASMALGLPLAPWALDWLLRAALATQHEFGASGSDRQPLLSPPRVDEAIQRDVQHRRFRAQAKRAARHTAYYQRLFSELDVDWSRLDDQTIACIPLTPKTALRDDPGAFVCSDARPVLYAGTSGTTGRPIGVAFSERELAGLTALMALGFSLNNQLRVDDVVYLCASGQGIGALTLIGACARIGALCIPAGLPPAEMTLARLAQPVHVSHKKRRPTVLQADGSYVGLLVEEGLRLGYGPRDFGIERVITGGEIVTAGLRRRLAALFGEVCVIETYGMTETFGAGGQLCSQGHVHFQPAYALVEVVDLIDPQTRVAAASPGSLVVTPLPPFRETTLLVRYDTEDLVQALPDPPSCELRGLFAVSHLLGKRQLAIRHDAGWTYPRDVLEALESIDDVPLPARCGIWPVAGGVGIELVARVDTSRVRDTITTCLEARGVPVRELVLRTERAELRRPFRLRCDSTAMTGRT